MYISASIQINCPGLTVEVKENTQPAARKNGTTIVSIGHFAAQLTLGMVTAEQLESIAADLNRIAMDMRAGSNPPCESVEVASEHARMIPDAVAADVEEIELGKCRLADHVLVGESNTHWTVISAKRVEGHVWIRNTKTGDRACLPTSAEVRRVK